jgi:nucleoside-diphosphate-sugar epimerase
MSWPKILVTGATGFIGGWVVDALCSAGAPCVVAGARHTSSRLERLPVQIVHCDVLDPGSLGYALEGVEVVIHCARDPAEGATVEGTRRLLEAIRDRSVTRLVHISSIAVYGNAGGVITEDVPAAPADQYGADKFAEEKLCHAAAGPDLTVAVVRPSLVYGPFGHHWTTRFMEAIVAGRLKTGGQGEANLIYAADLARFVVELAVQPLPEYSVYNANGPEIPSFDEYFDSLSQALGKGPLPVSGRGPVQAGLRRQARRAARLLLRTQRGMLQRIARGKPRLESALSDLERAFRHDVGDGPSDRFARHVVYSNDRAQQFGLDPKTSLRDGIRASVQWAKSSGAIQDPADQDGPRPVSRPAGQTATRSSASSRR